MANVFYFAHFVSAEKTPLIDISWLSWSCWVERRQQTICRKLATCITPFFYNVHSEQIVKLWIGLESPENQGLFAKSHVVGTSFGPMALKKCACFLNFGNPQFSTGSQDWKTLKLVVKIEVPNCDTCLNVTPWNECKLGLRMYTNFNIRTIVSVKLSTNWVR